MALEAVPFAVTKDQVLDGRLMLTQPRDGYRVAIDPILLAAAVPALGGERVLDLGCGIGTAALCVAKRVVDVAVTGIDIQPDLVALARNADENGLAARAAFEVSDVLALGDGSFDHVCANPPYLEAGKSSLSPNPIKAIANVEGAAKLADWVRAAISAVRECGSVTFIHRAERAAELRAAMAAGLGALRELPLLPKESAAAKRVLIQGTKGATSGHVILPGMALHDASGGFTPAAQAILRNMGPLSLAP